MEKLCLLACDLNPCYLIYWPLIRTVWLQYNRIAKVKLILIADEIPDGMEYVEDVILFPPIPGISTAFQAQCIRLLYPALMDNQYQVMISDIDYLQLDRRVITEEYVCGADELITTPELPELKQIRMEYATASPQVWRELFSVSNVSGIRKKLISWSRLHKPGSRHQWFCDQYQLWSHVQTWHHKNPGKWKIGPFRYENRVLRLPKHKNLPDHYLQVFKFLRRSKKSTKHQDMAKKLVSGAYNHMDLLGGYSVRKLSKIEKYNEQMMKHVLPVLLAASPLKPIGR